MEKVRYKLTIKESRIRSRCYFSSSSLASSHWPDPFILFLLIFHCSPQISWPLLWRTVPRCKDGWQCSLFGPSLFLHSFLLLLLPSLHRPPLILLLRVMVVLTARSRLFFLSILSTRPRIMLIGSHLFLLPPLFYPLRLLLPLLLPPPLSLLLRTCRRKGVMDVIIKKPSTLFSTALMRYVNEKFVSSRNVIMPEYIDNEI